MQDAILLECAGRRKRQLPKRRMKKTESVSSSVAQWQGITVACKKFKEFEIIVYIMIATRSLTLPPSMDRRFSRLSHLTTTHNLTIGYHHRTTHHRQQFDVRPEGYSLSSGRLRNIMSSFQSISVKDTLLLWWEFKSGRLLAPFQ
jgi:hypothetical protein